MSLPFSFQEVHQPSAIESYYRLLQSVREKPSEWENWILFMLKGIEETSIETIALIKSIKILMMSYKQKIRSELTKIYSQDLLNNLFKHPYTKIDFICQDLQVTRPTAVSYLNQLVGVGILSKMKMGRDNFYLNVQLFNLLMNAFHSESSIKDEKEEKITTY